ncbi:MAG: hypothetical protein ACREAM_08700 [Blastocatellia bacterium]
MSERTEGQSRGLPAGLRERVSWRPPAVRAAESLLSDALSRHAISIRRAARLSAWHERFIRRVQPWPGWSPLSLDFRSAEPPAEATGRRGDGAMGRIIRDPQSAIHGPQSTIHSPQPAIRNPQSAIRNPQSNDAPNRPALRLAILRPISTTNGRRFSTEANDALGGAPEERQLSSSDPSAVLRQHLPARALPATDGAAPELRLVTSARSTPRREVSGGFPDHHPSLPAHERTAVEPVAATLALRAIMDEPASPASASPASAPKSQGAIERLIEQTVMPIALPGLELRLAQPEQQASTAHDQPRAVEDRQPATSASAPPPLDINAIADKVWNTLQRRQQLERERRGLY